MPSLHDLGRLELLGLYDAAAEVIDSAAALAARGLNPVTAVLGGAAVVEEGAHFPPGDVRDAATASQYYYHAHAAAERYGDEHGHFHCFVAAPGASGLTHLAALSTDASGKAMRLFTTNRWVTGEAWCDAATAITLLDRFAVTADRPASDLNRWLTAMLRLFRPQIEDLLRARDAAIARWRIDHPQRDVLEDRDLAVTSEISVDVVAHIRAIEAAL